jgi:hypothetical protein
MTAGIFKCDVRRLVQLSSGTKAGMESRPEQIELLDLVLNERQGRIFA